jgi:uncharacterized protein YacL
MLNWETIGMSPEMVKTLFALIGLLTAMVIAMFIKNVVDVISLRLISKRTAQRGEYKRETDHHIAEIRRGIADQSIALAEMRKQVHHCSQILNHLHEMEQKELKISERDHWLLNQIFSLLGVKPKEEPPRQP